MKKIVCPSCGKVNFEAFVTYPNCSECGALLSDVENAQPKSVWRRPVGTLWWLSLLGVIAVAVAISVTLMGHTPDVEQDQLLVYGSLQRHLHVGSQTVMQLALDTVSASTTRQLQLTNVELRIPSELLKDWRLVSIEPPPKSTSKRGNGDYYKLGNLQINTVIFITWRARKPGEYRFSLTLAADNHQPARYMAVTQVDRKKGK
ncbi:MAG: hypothetical protein ABI210_06415 [Abditibacteriaceae bacterium]